MSVTFVCQLAMAFSFTFFAEPLRVCAGNLVLTWRRQTQFQRNGVEPLYLTVASTIALSWSAVGQGVNSAKKLSRCCLQISTRGFYCCVGVLRMATTRQRNTLHLPPQNKARRSASYRRTPSISGRYHTSFYTVRST